jgi:acyl-CoA thioesterase-2
MGRLPLFISAFFAPRSGAPLEQQPVDAVVRGLDLSREGEDRFLGHPGEGRGRLFGGMVAAQSVMAAQRTVEGGWLHSLHAYFLRPGSYGSPIRFVVHRIRDGRTYTTRRVVAEQNGEAIFSMGMSFTRPEQGGEHQLPMPDVPPPEAVPTWEEVRERAGVAMPIAAHVEAFESRLPYDEDTGPVRFVWLRPRGSLPEDPRVHIAATVYASDRTLAGAAAEPMGYARHEVSVTSLDHALWLHRVPCFDDWVLYVSESPAGYAARGLAFGAMYTRAGVRFASVAQEGLLRVPR